MGRIGRLETYHIRYDDENKVKNFDYRGEDVPAKDKEFFFFLNSKNYMH